MKKALLTLVMSSMSLLSQAQNMPTGIFIQALKSGSAEEELSHTPETNAVIKAVQAKTGSNSPLFIRAVRITRFTQQPSCGRVTFFITQPSTNVAWKDLGGDLNICESGTPPWRICAANPKELVPADAVCKDKSRPIETPEIAAAIQQSLSAGSLSHDQARALVVKQKAELSTKEQKK